ncbi:MAG TPA: type II toxin-antitoxin system RelE/ParE family toxin [Tepidisphaeraceae bacterium]|jgi:proteic killer suppression protein|nr:type II toxin-antitoxin system RelE/ParE family toxin [Tepidisphaeraceae bacterium]
MQIEFAADRWRRLAIDVKFTADFDRAIVKAYRKVIGFIATANDERDIRAYKALRLEKLKGDRSHQYSLRLNAKYRLIIEIKAADPKNIIVVVNIEDYH